MTVVEARDRVGGRVLTIRDAFAKASMRRPVHFNDHGQEDIRRLADQYGLTVRTILRQGFSFVRYKGRGQIHGRPMKGERAWKPIVDRAKPGSTPIGGRSSVGKAPSSGAWPSERSPNGSMRSTPTGTCAMVRGLRGFFLADPEGPLPAGADRTACFRGARSGTGGTHRRRQRPLPRAVAVELGEAVHLNTTARAVHDDQTFVHVTVERTGGDRTQMNADYVILAVPVTTLRAIEITPNCRSSRRKSLNG